MSRLRVLVVATRQRADSCAPKDPTADSRATLVARPSDPITVKRIDDAQSSIRASLASADAARERLEAAIEQTSSDGVPVKAMSEDDSMAVEMQDAKRDQQEAITRTERSRRARSL